MSFLNNLVLIIYLGKTLQNLSDSLMEFLIMHFILFLVLGLVREKILLEDSELVLDTIVFLTVHFKLAIDQLYFMPDRIHTIQVHLVIVSQCTLHYHQFLVHMGLESKYFIKLLCL